MASALALRYLCKIIFTYKHLSSYEKKSAAYSCLCPLPRLHGTDNDTNGRIQRRVQDTLHRERSEDEVYLRHGRKSGVPVDDHGRIPARQRLYHSRRHHRQRLDNRCRRQDSKPREDQHQGLGNTGQPPLQRARRGNRRAERAPAHGAECDTEIGRNRNQRQHDDYPKR